MGSANDTQTVSRDIALPLTRWISSFVGSTDCHLLLAPLNLGTSV
jgi:hypothetical protein